MEDRTVLAAPVVSSSVPDILVDQTVVTAGVKSLKIVYSSTVLGGDTASNYDLRNLGNDGAAGTADDVVFPCSVTYSGRTASLSFDTLPASTKNYQFTIFDDITDAALNKLDGDNDGAPGGDFVRAFTVVPAAAKTFVVAGFPTSTTAGAAADFTVTALDPHGNIATGYAGVVRFTSTDTAAALPADYTFSSVDGGVHRFSATLFSAGTRTITATDAATSTISGKQSGISVAPAAASRFVVTAAASTHAGSPLIVTVTAKDAYGNVATDYRGQVRITSTDSSATLPDDYTYVASDAGEHNFSVILTSAGSRTVTATDTVDATLTGKKSGIQVLGGPAAYFVATAPASAQSGVPYEISFSAKDVYGNFTSLYAGTVALSSSDPQAQLPANYTFTSEDAGQHTFTVTLFSPGTMNVAATDTAAPSITGKQSTTIVIGEYLWLPVKNTIYVNGITSTLTEIKSHLPAAPLTLVDPANRIWKLDANILLINGATLNLHGGASGDVGQLRLRSNNRKLSDGSEDPLNSIVIQARYGTISINDTQIISWDDAVGGPDTNPGHIPPRPDDNIPDDVPVEPSDHVRANISVRSFFAPDGVTPLESRMDVINSDIGYLGSHSTEGYGLSWKALGVGAAVHAKLRVYGDIIDSRIHHNFFGVYTYGAFQMNILGNEIDNNIWYGLDPHDDSNHFTIEGNSVHNNGAHGIVLSKHCVNATIRNNVVFDNHANGIMLHRSSNDALIKGNSSYGNGDSGLAIYEGFNSTIRNNSLFNNNGHGVRFSMGSSNNTFSNNHVYGNAGSGVLFFQGNDTPEVNDGRPAFNMVVGNTLHDNQSSAIRLFKADHNTIANNTLFNGGRLHFDHANNNVVTGNSLPVSALIRTIGDPLAPTTTFVRNQPSFLALVNSDSAIQLGDAEGTIYDVSGLPTEVTPSGSSLRLTAANTGSTSVAVNSRDLHVGIDAGSALVTPTVWHSAGSPQIEWTTTATAPAQGIDYTVGELTAGATYTVFKNGAFLVTQLADSDGHIQFRDAADTAANVVYSITESSEPPNEPPPTADDDTRYIQNIFHTVLLRGADNEGLQYWLTQLQTGATRHAVATGFWTSPEHRKLQVAHYYSTYLHRSAAQAEIDSWIPVFSNGDEERVKIGFLTSAEYLALHGTNDAFLTALYEDVLGRAPDIHGKNHWLEAMNRGSSRDIVVIGIVRSPESIHRWVDMELYRPLLGRPADPSALYWVDARLRNIFSETEIAARIIASAEFSSRDR